MQEKQDTQAKGAIRNRFLGRILLASEATARNRPAAAILQMDQFHRFHEICGLPAQQASPKHLRRS